MLSSRSARFVPMVLGVLGVPRVAAVMAYGELPGAALIAVVGPTGTAMAAVGLARRAGEAAAPVGPAGLPWLVWLSAAVAWELATLVDDRLPTLSDLLDAVLAHPATRGAATAGWLAAGAWLLARPHYRDESR